MRLSASYFPSRAEGLVLHSGLVQTILTTLVAILITWAVTAFLQRKRVAWRDYLANIQPVQIDGLGAEPGVIGNGPGKYRFWTVEYLYSYGTPPANSLPAAFLGYLNSYAAKDILRGRGYIPCADRGLTSVQAFWQP
jgi:hypothetical protein